MVDIEYTYPMMYTGMTVHAVMNSSASVHSVMNSSASVHSVMYNGVIECRLCGV